MDAVLLDREDYFGIEVKFRTRIGHARLRSQASPPVAHTFLLSKEEVVEGDKITLLPVDVFLSLLTPSARNI